MPAPIPSCRCFVPETELKTGRLELPAAEARHLGGARRLIPGAVVTVLNGRGMVGAAEVIRLDKRSGELELGEVWRTPAPEPGITMAVGALKRSAWDEFLKHAVELRVNRIVRVQSRNAVADVGENKEDRKHARWRDCMIQACKQSASPWLPDLLLADGVEEAFDRCAVGDRHILASLEPGARSLSQVVSTGVENGVVCWVGPEGDFTAGEYSVLRGRGAESVSLGSSILRSETAALALLAWFRLNRPG